MPQRLKLSEIMRVAFVDRGDNPTADVVIHKRAPEDVEKRIVERDGEFCVVSEDGSETLGCHETRNAAIQQLRAVEANKIKEDSTMDNDKSLLNKFTDFLKGEIDVDTDEFDKDTLSDDARAYVDGLEDRLSDLEKKLEGAVEASEADDPVEKKGEEVENPEGVLKGLDDEARELFTKMQERVEEAEKEAEAASEIVSKLNEEREVAKMRERVEKDFPALAGDIDKMATILKDAESALDEDSFKELTESLKSANEMATQAGVFDEWGPPTSDPSGPWQKIESRAKELVEKSDGSMSEAQAISKVMYTEEGARLYNEYLSESN